MSGDRLRDLWLRWQLGAASDAERAELAALLDEPGADVVVAEEIALDAALGVRPARRIRWLPAAAAAAVLGAVLGAVLAATADGVAARGPGGAVLAWGGTARGGTWETSDGARIELDTEARAVAERSGRWRLEAGGAMVDLDPGRHGAAPWSMAGRHATAAVLGTRFRLADGPGGTALTVFRGRVRMETAAGSLVVEAGGGAIAAGGAPEPVAAAGRVPMLAVEAFRAGEDAGDDPAYGDLLAWLRPDAVRIGRSEAGLPGHRLSWLAPGRDDAWDGTRVARILGRTRGPVWLVVPEWPASWSDRAGRLLPEREEDWIRRSTALLALARREGRPVVRCELRIRDAEARYRTDPEALGRILARASAGLRGVDPAVRIAGPGGAPRQSAGWLARLRTAGGLDELSVTVYGPGRGAPPAVRFAAVETAGGEVAALRAAAGVPVVVGELSPAGEAGDRFIDRPEAGAWHGLALAVLAHGGVAAVSTWCDADGWNGLAEPVRGGLRRRPAAAVQALAARWLRPAPGAAVATLPTGVRTLALRMDGMDGLWMVNLSPATAAVPAGIPASALTEHAHGAHGRALPPWAVAVAAWPSPEPAR